MKTSVLFPPFQALTLVGAGWKGASDEDVSDLGPENRKVKVTVSGKNIGYGSTCECMVQAALVILQESNRYLREYTSYPRLLSDLYVMLM